VNEVAAGIDQPSVTEIQGRENAVLKTAGSRQACMRSGGKPSRGASIDGDVDDIRHHNASRFEER
jgi:hypothetical protein